MAIFEGRWQYDEDRCYHGINEGDAGNRIIVELSSYGWTDRLDPLVLRELSPADPHVGFNWGYLGSGPNAAAHAILADALGFEPTQRMRQAFVWDWLGMAAREFHWRRPAILRWARGLVAQYGVSELPAVLAELPPVSRDDNVVPPPEVRERRRDPN